MARTVARRTTPDLLDWQRNREVQRLTREILALQHDVAAKVVAVVAEMGTPSGVGSSPGEACRS